MRDLTDLDVLLTTLRENLEAARLALAENRLDRLRVLLHERFAIFDRLQRGDFPIPPAATDAARLRAELQELQEIAQRQAIVVRTLLQLTRRRAEVLRK